MGPQERGFHSLVPGTPFETLGEKLARTERLDSLTLPRTMFNYARVINGKLTPKQVRRLAEDFLQAQHAIAARLRPPTLNTLSLCRPGSCFHSSAVASSSQTSA